MTTFDLAASRAQLKTLLQTCTTLAVVYDYRNPSIQAYPAAIFDVSDNKNDMLDDANNIRVLTFTIWLVQEMKTSGAETAKTLLDNVTKQVVATLELKSNDTLGSTVDWIMPVEGRREEVSSPEGMIIFQEVKLQCHIASSIL